MLKTADVKGILAGSNDIVFVDLCIYNDRQVPATLVFIEGLVDADMIDDYILRPLTQPCGVKRFQGNIIDYMVRESVNHCAQKVADECDDVVKGVLSGNAALIMDSLGKAVIFEVKGFKMRGVSEPTAENVVKGAKDSFVEVLRVNTATVRRRIQSAELRIEEISVGTKAPTNVAVIYMSKAADSEVVDEVIRRVKSIDLEAIKSPGNIEEKIVDQRYSLFPQTVLTERPDRLCANLLEGKVGVIIDGYPIAYVMPIVFNMLFQSAEDYSFNYFQASMVRLLRYASAFLSLILPALYVGIMTFHHEMLPTNLLASIIKSKESVPFSSLMEVIFLLIAFEILLESGVRLPNSIGQAVSIVGGLVVGEAAVSAKFVSPAVVVVIAITGICGCMIPNHNLSNAFRILRVLLVLVSDFMGLYGLSLALVLVLHYACTMSSVGKPMMSFSYPHMKYGAFYDGLTRLPEQMKSEGQS